MENIRPILYGVADYAEIRKANAWFVDRTAKIRDLEGTRYAMFLRPRRFGKSFWASILEAYYDVACANRFDDLFKGTDIAHAALIEMKYVKAGDSPPTAEQLADIKAKAIEQLDQYAADHDIATEWHLAGTTGIPPVELHRLVLVFHGGEAMLAEEV